MPLETYKGTSIPALMLQAQRDLGDDVRIIEVNRIRTWNGSPMFELVAADDQGCDDVGKTFVTSSNERKLTMSALETKPETESARPRVIAVVGPTGAGKTTTIAKLIGNPRMTGGARPGVLSLDGFRVGAVHQLGSLAKMAGAPFEAPTEEELARSFKQLAERDVVFVDTPGRGPRAQRESAAVDRMLTELRPDEVHIAVPAGLSADLTKRIVSEYRNRGATHLLATKLDEMPGDWSIFDIAAELHMPMRWVTDGQEIPTDVRPARPRLQAAMAGRQIVPDFG